MIPDREARRIAAPILAAEEETLDGARDELQDIAREYEIKRTDTPQQAEQKASRAKELMAAALLAYLLLRRRKGSEAGIEAARRNLGRLGLATTMAATLGRALSVPVARATTPLRVAVDGLTTRLVRGALTRIPGAALRLQRGIFDQVVIRGKPVAPGRFQPVATGARPGAFVRRTVTPPAAPGATQVLLARPGMTQGVIPVPGSLDAGIKAYQGGLERIVQVDTWQGASFELRRIDQVAMALDSSLQREWVATLDKRTCPVCRKMDGKVATAATPFDIEPPVHPYCRCVVLLTRG